MVEAFFLKRLFAETGIKGKGNIFVGRGNFFVVKTMKFSCNYFGARLL